MTDTTTESSPGPTMAATTAELLLRRADDRRPGLMFEGSRWSWAEVVHEGARRAALALDLRRDGPFHVGVLLDNEPEYLFWIVGAALSGAAVVGINSTRRGAELAHDVAHTDCQLIVTDRAHLELLDGLDLHVPDDRVLLVDTDGYRQAVEAHADADPHQLAEAVTPDQRLLLLFTSGSTGAPKAVVCTQARFAGIAQVTPGLFGVSDRDVCYNAMPMFHGNALMASWALCLGCGAPWAIRRKFSASGFLPDVRAFGATYVNYVGRALAYVLATPEQPDDADNPLRLCFGTEATDRDMAEFSRRFGCTFAESYGSSEGPISIAKTPDSPPTALGRSREGDDVVVMNPVTLEECPPARFGEHGELLNSEAIGELVRRNAEGRFEGYYNNPDATAERLRNGWYWSGDLAYRDADGWFYFAGRGSDWLRVDSENFATTPIERIVARFPGVLVNAVYPVPDSRTGDQVMVSIELVPGTDFDAGAFDDFLAAQDDLGTKWSPRFVRVVDAMPLTGSNKLNKQPLRARRWDGPGRVWWRPERGDRLRPMSDDDRAHLATEFEANGLGHLLR
jgi:fatty-acyl-CoA synthase